MLRQSTACCDICCKRKDESTSWEKSSSLKELHLNQAAEYAIAQSIQHEQAFNWWVHHVLKKRYRIISMVRQCRAGHSKRIYKLGLKLQKWSGEKNGNTLWQDAIQKNIEHVMITFQTTHKGKKPPNGYQYDNCHMVFNI